ncbi:MAG: type I glyceraldehyde-3-phosphate dehydrogenase [bacterium]|nr:type I glyceraldehyde-3-phosphate dehydrogenase [bacterium]
MAKIAINGFGRIGRLFFRQAFGTKKLDIVAINDLGDIENLAYLLKYDSVYREYNREVSFTRNADNVGGILIVNGKKITVLCEKEPTKLPWGAMKVDVVVEATGMFESFEKAAVHINAGKAKHVVISAPAKDAEGVQGGMTALMGINEDKLSTCAISSNGSCTTNAVAPVVAVLNEKLGIAKATMSTVHAYTATQSLTDSPTRGSDFRRGRAAATNITPSTTGAAISVTRALPNLVNKFDGIALRVPVIAGSLIDLTFVSKRKTTIEEVNALLVAASKEKRWQGILGIAPSQLVSTDIIGMSYASLVDLEYTKVIDGDLVKVLSWYDNEWGYVTTLVSHVLKVA